MTWAVPISTFRLPAHRFTGWATVSIPGPLSSFARMAALSPDVAPEDLLPALARNIVTNGYEAAGNETLQQTEYLRLLNRYIGQARELQSMAGSGRQIVIPACDSDQTGALLKILGYRMRGSCGTDIVLETVNPTKAFLTVDSGFPLTTLEQDLRANHRFELPYSPTSVPVLYSADYWLSALGKQGSTDFLDGFLSDAQLCRLYLGLSHLDRETAEALRKQSSRKNFASTRTFWIFMAACSRFATDRPSFQVQRRLGRASWGLVRPIPVHSSTG